MRYIPRAEVSFSLSPSSLPIGLPIVYFSERGHVEVERQQGDTLKITAVCDSLQRLVYMYEQQIDALKSRVESATSIDTVIKPVPWYYKAAMWVCVALLLYIFLPRIKPFIKRMLTKNNDNG